MTSIEIHFLDLTLSLDNDLSMITTEAQLKTKNLKLVGGSTPGKEIEPFPIDLGVCYFAGSKVTRIARHSGCSHITRRQYDYDTVALDEEISMVTPEAQPSLESHGTKDLDGQCSSSRNLQNEENLLQGMLAAIKFLL